MLGLSGFRNRTSLKSLNAGLLVVAVFLSVVFPLKLIVCQDVNGLSSAQLSVNDDCCQDACCHSASMVSAFNTASTQTTLGALHCQDDVYFVAHNASLGSSFSFQYESPEAPVVYYKTTGVHPVRRQPLNSVSCQLISYLALPPPYLMIRKTTVLLV